MRGALKYLAFVMLLSFIGTLVLNSFIKLLMMRKMVSWRHEPGRVEICMVFRYVSSNYNVKKL